MLYRAMGHSGTAPVLAAPSGTVLSVFAEGLGQNAQTESSAANAEAEAAAEAAAGAATEIQPVILQRHNTLNISHTNDLTLLI